LLAWCFCKLDLTHFNFFSCIT